MPITEQDLNSIGEFLNQIIGKPVHHVRCGPYWYNPILVEFVPLDSQVRKPSKWYLSGINSLWRIETDTEFICGAFDNREYIETQIIQLHGKKLQSVTVKKPLYEATFQFDDNFALHFFPTLTTKVPHWTFHTPDKQKLSIGPSTNWSIKAQKSNSE